MNKRLEQQLNVYFYGEYYEKVKDGEELKAAYETYYNYLQPLRQTDKKLFFELEDAIARAEVEYERRGFLQGYQYALIMLGLSV